MTDDRTTDRPDESPEERLARNWAEILQELRVIQSGSQIITGFLLAAAFQQRFTELSSLEYALYFALLGTAIVTTIVGMTPVMVHRRLFRMGAKASIVHLGDRFATAALVGVGVTLAGIALLITELVAGLAAGLLAAAVAVIVMAVLWILLPGSVGRGARSSG